MPGYVDLDVYQGDDHSWDIRVVEDGVPVDLTDLTLSASVRRRDADTEPDPLAVFTIEVTDPVDGRLTLGLPATESVKLRVASAWDLEVFTTEGAHTLLAGRVAVTREVTRP